MDPDGDGTLKIITVQKATVPQIPAEYDLKLTFNPLRNANSTNNGTANVTVWVEKKDNPTLFSQESFVLRLRPSGCAGAGQYSAEPESYSE
ncbi:MAG: hypothetical protein R2941_10110 [Desulfobacterales bacterium]